MTSYRPPPGLVTHLATDLITSRVLSVASVATT